MSDDRALHQPIANPPAHKQLDPALQAQICGNTVAIVLADDWNTTPLTVTFDDPDRAPYVCDGRDGDAETAAVELPRPLQFFDGKPLVAHAVDLACSCGFADVLVLLCNPGCYEQDARAAIGDKARVQTLSQERLDAAKEELNLFELFCINSAALLTARDLLDATPAADNAMFIGCTSPRITPWHIAQLCLRQDEKPDCDVVFSWIYWLRRLPVLVSRGFFETARKQHLFELRPGSFYRPLPMLDVEEVVFGEEKLAGNESSSAARDAFFAAKPMSALEAVALAHKLESANADDAAKTVQGLSQENRVLLGNAQHVVANISKKQSSDTAKEIARASAWGKRNMRDFAIFDDRQHKGKLVYLDSAATSQRLLAAVNAEASFNNNANANIYRGSYGLSAQATAAFNEARIVLEDHLGSARRQMAFTANTSDSANKAAQSWALRNLNEGDAILITLSEHHSNMLPWRIAAQARGAEVHYTPLDGSGRIDMDAYRQLLQEHRVKLVCVAQISNSLGLINPVREMADAAHAAGARIFVDAAQSFPHLAINVQELECDFLAFSGHKAYGPFGVGGLWISDAAFAEMDPAFAGGGTISHVGRDSYYLRQGAIQYELGTPPIAQAIGLARAVEQLDELGMDAVAAHSAALTKHLLAGLELLADVTVWGDHTQEDGQTGLVSFTLYGVSCARVAGDLGALGVCIRAGGQCALPFHAAMGLDGSCRISLGIHNTAQDIEAAITAIAMSAKLAGKDKVFID